MSIQAVAWALEQDLPQGPKLVLVSLANHANHTDGYCWLNAETIGREGSCSPRSVFRYVGGLVRNGYVRKSKRKSDDGKQRANDYWLLFEREEKAWDWGAHLPEEGIDQPQDEPCEDVGSPQDIDEPTANLAHGETSSPTATYGTRQAENTANLARGPSATAVTRERLAEPSESKPKESLRPSLNSTAPRAYRPPPPEPQAAVVSEGKQIFVYEGTRAWDAWCAFKLKENGVRWTLTRSTVIEGKSHSGWWFPSLFPPKADDVPKSLATESELQEFANTS